MSYANQFAALSHYKNSKRGKIVDFVINFHEKQQDIELIVTQTYEIFDQLIQHYFQDGKRVKARLVARVRYKHSNAIDPTRSDERIYYFPSYQSEEIEDPEDFFTSHMMKIASRMDNFHSNGSNLVLAYIEHIHVEINVVN